MNNRVVQDELNEWKSRALAAEALVSRVRKWGEGLRVGVGGVSQVGSFIADDLERLLSENS